MQAIFYKNRSDSRKIGKDLLLIKSRNVSPYETFSISAPAFILQYDPALITANYVYIPELQRYYFINVISLERGSKMIVNCRVDVLESFKNSILNLTCNVVKNESIGENLVIDSDYVFISESDVEIFRFPFEFSSQGIGSADSVNFVVSIIG